MHIAVIQRAAVMRAHHKEANGFGVKAFQHIADGEKVAQTFGHFFVVHIDKTVVHPGVHKGLAIGAFALGNFGFVVRKLQVGAAAVNVQRFTEQFAGHGRALNVPAGATRAKHAGPFGVVGFFGFGALPQHGVERVLFAFAHRHALTSAQIIERFAAQLPVVGKVPDRQIHVTGVFTARTGTAVRAIGQTLLFQSLDHVQHRGHMVGGAGLKAGALDVEGVKVLVHGVDHAAGQGANALTVFQSTANDLVVNVGDVANISHLVSRNLEPALHHIECHVGAGMTDVAVIVNRQTANIQSDMAWLNRRKHLQLAGQCVVDAQTQKPLGYNDFSIACP